jgi:hypothetical protein
VKKAVSFAPDEVLTDKIVYEVEPALGANGASKTLRNWTKER